MTYTLEREAQIQRLTDLINKREDTFLTTEQVDNYIGSDMSNDKLKFWVDETEDWSNPITAQEVMDLWDE